jgi:hypothetical protein
MDPDQSHQAGLDLCRSQNHYVGFVVTRLKLPFLVLIKFYSSEQVEGRKDFLFCSTTAGSGKDRPVFCIKFHNNKTLNLIKKSMQGKVIEYE